MEDDDDLMITARVLPENRKVYETLLELLLKHGETADDINTQLFNVGLTVWVSKISEGLANGPEAMMEEDE
jgi:hypothetical protein